MTHPRTVLIAATTQQPPPHRHPAYRKRVDAHTTRPTNRRQKRKPKPFASSFPAWDRAAATETESDSQIRAVSGHAFALSPDDHAAVVSGTDCVGQLDGTLSWLRVV